MREIVSLYAELAEEDNTKRTTIADRILGLATMVFVSAGGWALIIAAARLLR